MRQRPGLCILNTEPAGYSNEAREILQNLGQLIEVDCDRTELLNRLDDVDVLIVRLGHQIDADLLNLASNLKVIVSATTGLDHIDTSVAQSLGIKVMSLRKEDEFLSSITSTAEHAWGLLLTLARHIPEAHDDVMLGNWSRDRFRGQQLSGKTLGLVGYGRLGRIVAEYGRVFRMHVLANDIRTVDNPKWVTMVDLRSLLRESHVVMIQASLEENSNPIIGGEELSWMRPDAMLINTARGRLVDETALVGALKSGRLAAAAVDVLVGEISGDPTWQTQSPAIAYARDYANLIVTPHIGGAAPDAMAATEVFMAQKLAEYLTAAKAP